MDKINFFFYFYDNLLIILICLQSDREKEEGLPVAPFMDRDKVTKPTAQIGFIKFVLIPMFETFAKVRKLFIFVSGTHLFCIVLLLVTDLKLSRLI